MSTLNLEFVSAMALSVLLVLAIWYDWRVRKIPNTLVLWGVLTALGLSLTPRGIGLDAALLGGLTGFLVFLLLYVFKMVGAGDVKLIAALGLFVGWPDMAKVCVAILLAGGLLAVAWGLWTSNMLTVLKNLRTGLTELIRAGQWPSLGQPLISQVTSERVPYALAVGLGTAAYYVATTSFRLYRF
jgi:prepilin peptidase CpaA